MIQNLATQEQLNELNASLVTSNNKQFQFAYDSTEDTYGYQMDGEFHPFGNPYLKWDEENGQILALDTDGNWVKIYNTIILPISSKYDILADTSIAWNGQKYTKTSSQLSVVSDKANYSTAYAYTTTPKDLFTRGYIYINASMQVYSGSSSNTFSTTRRAIGYLQVSNDGSNWTNIKSWTAYGYKGQYLGEVQINEYINVSAYSNYKYIRIYASNPDEVQNHARFYVYSLKSCSSNN